jgi:ribokinase
LAADVVVVGGVNVDYCVTAQRLPVAGETVNGGRFFTAFGGKGANQAVAAARAGASTAMIARVGGDSQGREVLENLRQNGVDASGVVRDALAPTGTAHIVVSDSGQNQIVVIPGANHNLCPADIEAGASLIRGARLLMLVLEGPMETTLYAARLARAAGKTVVLDPAPAQPLPAELYGLVDYILPNETEASAISGIHVHDRDSAALALHLFRSRGVKTPVVKLGAQGAVALRGDEVLYSPPFPVDVVDSTAAGDAFAGGFCSALTRGLDFATCMRIASAAGALACTRYGAMPSLPSETEIRTLSRG